MPDAPYLRAREPPSAQSAFCFNRVLLCLPFRRFFRFLSAATPFDSFTLMGGYLVTSNSSLTTDVDEALVAAPELLMVLDSPTPLIFCSDCGAPRAVFLGWKAPEDCTCFLTHLETIPPFRLDVRFSWAVLPSLWPLPPTCFFLFVCPRPLNFSP